MSESDEKYKTISKQSDLNYLIERIVKGRQFAYEFKFTERKYFKSLLESLEIDYEEFSKNYYYHDTIRPIHISESQFEYVWISTYGLIAKDKATSNKVVNACASQYTVISILLDKAIEISENENVFDVDGYNFGLLSELSPAIFHQALRFYQSLCLADSEVLRNRHLRVAANRCISFYFNRNVFYSGSSIFLSNRPRCQSTGAKCTPTRAK